MLVVALLTAQQQVQRICRARTGGQCCNCGLASMTSMPAARQAPNFSDTIHCTHSASVLKHAPHAHATEPWPTGTAAALLGDRLRNWVLLG